MPSTPQIAAELSEFDSFTFDLDGVVWLGGEVITGAAESFAALRAAGKQITIFSNNSSRSRSEFRSELQAQGIELELEDIVTSGSAAASYVLARYGPSKVHVMGKDGLRQEVEEAGHTLCDRRAQVVIAGSDKDITWDKINNAFQNIYFDGAKFIATNDDATYVTKDGKFPGTGANIGALAAAVSRVPDVVVGKPNPPILEILLKRIGSRKAVLFGDKLSKDIRSAHLMKIASVLVLSGSDSRESLLESEIKPDLVLDSVAQIIQ